MAILRPYFTPYLTPVPAQLISQLNLQNQQQQPQYGSYIQPQPTQPNQPEQFQQTPYSTADTMFQQYNNIQQYEQQSAFKPTPQGNDPVAASQTNPVTNFLQTSAARPDFQTFYNQLQGISDIGSSATAAAQAQAAARAQALIGSLGDIGGGQGNASGFGGALSGAKASSVAQSLLGIPYVWGGTDRNGLDCSGLVFYVLNHSGIKVPRLLASGYGRMGTAVNLSQAQPGDIVYYDNPGSTDHVGIYIGNGKMIDAPYTGARVRVDNVGHFTSIRHLGSLATGTTPIGINAGIGQKIDPNKSRLLGHQLLVQAGLGSQWNSFDKLIMSESGWRNWAQNPGSTAFGIGQFLDSTWRNYGSKTWDPRSQILYTLKYIRDRYKTPAAAWAFKLIHGYY